ncbi:MAG: hypothetical protein JW889_16270 [Verrucomicrobia bacterium]|nr:hypothetical protein [Verrucomicrobiota bacterium]
MAGRRAVLLRVLLIAAAFGWGISFLGVFLPWPTVDQVLRSLGASDVPHDAMVVYWVRGTAATFGFIGVMFAVAALRPERHTHMIFWLAILMLGTGTASLLYGRALKVPAFPFVGDVTFCLAVGAGILALRKARAAFLDCP